MARYVCGQPKLSSVLNVQDSNGDTALHRAVGVGNLVIFNCLIRNPKVDLSIPNKDDLTPLDLSWNKIPRQSLYYGSVSLFLILYILRMCCSLQSKIAK